MNNQEFICGKCGKTTPLNIKTDKLKDDVQRVYAKCNSCGGKTTVYYTDKHIRKLMRLQKVAHAGADKANRAQQIIAEQNALKAKFE